MSTILLTLATFLFAGHCLHQCCTLFRRRGFDDPV